AFDRVFYEIDRATGVVSELFTAEGWFWAGAATDGRHVYAPSLDGTLYAYDTRNRTVIWTYEEADPQPILSAPVVVGDKIVMASDSGAVTLLSAGGVRLDSFVNPGDQVRAPLTVLDDVVYVHSLGEVVTALRVAGTRLEREWVLEDVDR
ncbi:MAG: PQQ-binding-like beta-propeller repeat protein, partial [Chloroflexi bacterium]|nr:PQQ-binding-like beta-propeller repeat protein [Chloroflexota bacterium]